MNFIQPTREGYRLLPLKQRRERDEQIVRLFDMGVACKGIAQIVGMDYEGARRVLRKAKRMGKRRRVDIMLTLLSTFWR